MRCIASPSIHLCLSAFRNTALPTCNLPALSQYQTNITIPFYNSTTVLIGHLLYKICTFSNIKQPFIATLRRSNSPPNKYINLYLKTFLFTINELVL